MLGPGDCCYLDAFVPTYCGANVWKPYPLLAPN